MSQHGGMYKRTGAQMSREQRRSREESASEIGDTRESGWFDSQENGESFPCGCSMLSRIRLRPRDAQAFAIMRCSLGYALRTDDDVAKCLEVEGPGECWKTEHNWRVAPVESPRMAEQTRRQIAAITHNGESTEPLAPSSVDPVAATARIEVTEVIKVTHIRVTGDADGTD